MIKASDLREKRTDEAFNQKIKELESYFIYCKDRGYANLDSIFGRFGLFEDTERCPLNFLGKKLLSFLEENEYMVAYRTERWYDGPEFLVFWDKEIFNAFDLEECSYATDLGD